jgi:hypothetical protein
MKTTRAIVCGLALVAAACNEPDLVSPTAPTTATTVAAEPTFTETVVGTVPVGGYSFYSFTVTVYGTVNVTLNSVQGQFVPATVMLGLGLGTPSGEDCATTATVTIASGTAIHVTQTLNPGVACVRVFDVGNLFAPATFNVSVAYP